LEAFPDQNEPKSPLRKLHGSNLIYLPQL